MSRGRIALGAVGVLGAAYGLRLLVLRPFDDILSAFEWLVAGVLLHDLVLGPLALLLGLAAVRLLGWRGGGAVVSGLVVVGTLTLMAIPVLGRFGAEPRNPSLLNRDYWAGWLVLVLLVSAAVALAVVKVRRGHRDRA